MNLKRLALLTLVMVFVALTVVMAAAPAGQAQAQGSNLLLNPSFEDGVWDKGLEITSYAPNGWDVWYNGNQSDCYNRMPNFDAMTNPIRVRSGYNAFYMWGSFMSFEGGLIQQVTATPGNIYFFEIWSHTVAEDYADIQVKVGIDPYGGGDPYSSNVVWSGVKVPTEAYQDSPDLNYQQFAVEATAQADRITVFTWAKPNWCVSTNEVYYDDAFLGISGTAAPAPTATTAGDTGNNNAPTNNTGVTSPNNIQIAQANEDGRIVHTVQSGDTLTAIAVAYGTTITRIRELNGLDSSVIILGQRLIIEPGGGADAAPTEAPAEGEGDGGDGEGEDGEGEQPAEAPQPTAVAEVVATGSVCIVPFHDENSNGFREATETSLAGIAFTVVNEAAQTVGSYITDGSPNPYCFTDLAPGVYTVSWNDANFAATTEQQWAADVSTGGTVTREFGLQSEGENSVPASANEPDTSLGGDTGGGGGLPVWVTALIGAVGVIFLLGGLGAAGYFFLLRRTKV